MKPINIIGGGLAGLSLALGLRRQGVPVIVHEAGNYPRHRVCGEFILGVSDNDIEALGIGNSLADSLRHQECAWFAGDKFASMRTMPMAARAISRHRLDERLASECRNVGVDLRCGSRVEETVEPGWVRAAGRERQSKPKWLGLKAHYLNLRLEAGLEMHLGNGGYVGLTRVEDGRVNVCALLPAAKLAGNKADFLPGQLREIGLHEVASRLERAKVDEASVTGVTHFTTGWQPAANEPGNLVLGDSHSMIPPFTGAGMSMAFESAAQSLPFLIAYSKGETDWLPTASAIQIRLKQHFKKRLWWANVVHRALLSKAGPLLLKTAVRSPLLPFDSLVRVLRGA